MPARDRLRRICRPAERHIHPVLRKLNASDYTGAANQFLVWNRAGGTVLRGLVRRRSAERSLFTNGTWDPRAQGRISVNRRLQFRRALRSIRND
ncbi:glycoside hydrolase family protein [Burkholderia ubonensis]|uniref:glycoside hydrolase family protein n=1 Tax=Burkholderia ubonensis TaxID=101571 RepID=UPI0039F455A3